jgi:23S rRNA (uracil1939-C5)-methyltransferase
MSRREATPRRGEEVTVDIVDLAFGGRGVGRVAGFVVFVEGALPGESVRARVERVKSGYAEAVAVRVLSRSPERIDPPCRHYGECGGCDLQHLSPAAQAEAKGLQVRGMLVRLAGLADPRVEPAVVAGTPTAYRFRMDFDWGTGSDGRPILGLHRAGRPAEILPLERCLLMPDQANAIRRFAAERARRLGLAAWDRKRRRGLLRRLGLQMAQGTGEVLVTLESGRGDPPALSELARDLVHAFPRVVGVVRREFDRLDRLVGESILLGRDHLFEQVEGDRLKVPAGSFFQPNAPGASRLRQVVLAALDAGAHESILELHCGVGFFSLPVARRARQVTGLDVSREAVAAARDNAARAGLGNTTFLCRDVEDSLPELLRETRPDALLLDPPRTGLPKAATHAVAAAAVARVVYVSCDPATLARDIRLLGEEGGLRLRSVTPLDLFPQTHHLEAVARLERA